MAKAPVLGSEFLNGEQGSRSSRTPPTRSFCIPRESRRQESNTKPARVTRQLGRTWGGTRCSVSTPAPASTGSLRATAARPEKDGSVIACPVSPQKAQRAVPGHSALRHVVADSDQGDRARKCKFPTPSMCRQTTSSLQVGLSSVRGGCRSRNRRAGRCGRQWPSGCANRLATMYSTAGLVIKPR